MCQYIQLPRHKNRYKLNLQDHVNGITNKISKYISILNRIKKYFSLKTLLFMYNSFILSSFNYGIYGYNTDRLFELQKRAVMVICKSKFNAYTDPIFKNLQILKIKDLHKLHVIKLYYQLIHENIPHYFTLT